MKRRINLIEKMAADLDDPNFMNGMENLLGMDSDAVEELLDKLDANSLMALTDAVAKQDQAAAQTITDKFEDTDVNSLFRGNDIEQKKNNKKEDKKTPSKPPEDHEFAIGDDVAIKMKNEDTGEDDFVSATVFRPHAPGDTIGVKIEGKPKMVNKDDVYTLNEMVLGMVGVPNIQRMQQLAGIQPNGGAEPESVQVSAPQQASGTVVDSDTALALASQALDTLATAISDIRVGDMKVVRQRMMTMMNCLNESIVTKQPSGRSKKL